MLALVEYRASLCSECGFPVETCSAGDFTAHRRLCGARLVLLETQRAAASADGKNPPLSADARVWSISTAPGRR